MSDYGLIRNTIARNNQYLDDRRYDDCSRTFTDDDEIAGHKGRAAILEFTLSQGSAPGQSCNAAMWSPTSRSTSQETKPTSTATCSYTTKSVPGHGSSRRSAATPIASPGNPTAPGYSPCGVSRLSSDDLSPDH